MRPYLSASHATQFGRLRKLARKVVTNHYGLQCEKIVPIGHWENTTFFVRARTPVGIRKEYVCRIHRPGYNSREEIETELKLIEDLDKQHVIRVPRLIRTRDGHRTTIASYDGVPEERVVSMFESIAGYNINNARSEHYEIIGWSLGRIHQFTHQPGDYGERKYWCKGRDEELKISQDFFIETEIIAGRECREIWESSVEESIHAIESNGLHTMQLPLIHGDLHCGNIILKQNRFAGVIDFDDMVYGPRELDVATSLLGAHGEQYDANLQALVMGYKGSCDLELDVRLMTKDLQVLRMLWLGRWLVSRTDNERLRNRFPRVLDWMNKVRSEIFANQAVST